jgi:calcineurin-like phosphoesterase
MGFDGVIKRFERGGRFPMQPASGPGTLCGVLVDVADTGLCAAIRPLRVGGVLQETEAG